jgi:hypothetical protein
VKRLQIPETQAVRKQLSLVALLLAAAIAPVAHAAPSGFAFLEVPAGARASALSGAFATLGEGVEAGFWNPAGLAAVKGVEISGAHFESFQNLRHDQFAVAREMLGGGLAGSLRAFYSEPITARDELGNEIGTFGGNDLEFGLSYGRPLAEAFRIGGGVRLLHERIADLSTDSYAFAAGATWQSTAHPGLRLAAMADHLGPDANFTFADGPGQPIPMPMAFQGGASYRFALGGTASLAAALEGRMVRGRPTVGMLGGELTHRSGAALRIGTRMNDDASRFSAGAGYTMGSLRLDYAFVADDQDIGDSHRFSFTAHF